MFFVRAETEGDREGGRRNINRGREEKVHSCRCRCYRHVKEITYLSVFSTDRQTDLRRGRRGRSMSTASKRDGIPQPIVRWYIYYVLIHYKLVPVLCSDLFSVIITMINARRLTLMIERTHLTETVLTSYAHVNFFGASCKWEKKCLAI